MKKRRFNTFLATAAALLVIWYFYVAHRVLATAGYTEGMSLALWTLLAVPFGLVFWLPASYWPEDHPPSRLRDLLVYGAYLAMGFLSFLFLACVARDVAWVIARLVDQSDVAASAYSPAGSLALLVFSLLLLISGMFFARKTPSVTRAVVPISSSVPELHGLRIAQISDLHIGTMIRREFVERVVETINKLDADLVALTGDIFDGNPDEHADDFEPLARLRAKHGIYYVTGNHEYYWNAPAWTRIAEELGMVPLLNSHRVVKRGAAKLVVAGVTDFWHAGSDPHKALSGAPTDALKILLAHQPQTAFKAVGAGYHLQLSGHTHGGQFMPWTLIAHLVHKFPRGLKKFGEMWVYVNRGTGFWGPPVRLGSPSEITLIELRTEPHFA